MPKPALRAVKYYGVSVLTFGANVFIAWTLIHFFAIHYLTATIVGFLFQTTTSFFVNRNWTFHVNTLKTENGLVTTTGVQLSALLIILSAVWVGVSFFSLPFVPVRIISGIIAGVWSYVMDSHFTFHTSLFR